MEEEIIFSFYIQNNSIVGHYNTFHETTEKPKTHMTFETFDQSDEETWTDKKTKPMTKTERERHLEKNFKEQF